MLLQGFTLGSAAEVLDDAAGEEDDGVEVGFGFGDGYDLGASSKAGLNKRPLKGVSYETASGIAVEADTV